MKRIIGIGNRFVIEDAVGPADADFLMDHPLPDDVEVIDGGLAGLDLLPVLDGAERVVFVDRVCGFADEGSVVLLDVEDIRAAMNGAYGHAEGLGYLLRVLPHVCVVRVPEVIFVGVEGNPTKGVVVQAAALCLDIANRGRPVRSTPTPRRRRAVARAANGARP